MQNSKINFQLATFRLQLLPTCNLQRGMQHRMSVTEKRVACELEISKAQQKKAAIAFIAHGGRGATTAKGQRQDSTTMRVQQRMKKTTTITKPKLLLF